MQRCVLCRSRRELSQEYLLAKIGVDTAENELLVNPNRVRVFTHNVTRNYAFQNYAYGRLSHGPRLGRDTNAGIQGNFVKFSVASERVTSLVDKCMRSCENASSGRKPVSLGGLVCDSLSGDCRTSDV